MKRQGQGWYYDSFRHSLAAKGVRTRNNYFKKESELRKGIKIEMEHTDDPKIARKIAEDHLAEDSKYYSKLQDCFPKEHEQK